MDELLDTEAAAAYIGVSLVTLHRVTKRAELPVYKRPGWRSFKYKRSDLDNWIAAGLVAAQQEPTNELDTTDESADSTDAEGTNSSADRAPDLRA
jgi:excisionase family DNA binding protein